MAAMGGNGVTGVERVRGHVKWFNPKKGYGFVELDPPGAHDIFLHIHCLPEGIQTLQDGQPLSCVVEETRKGPRATNVQLETADARSQR